MGAVFDVGVRVTSVKDEPDAVVGVKNDSLGIGVNGAVAGGAALVATSVSVGTETVGGRSGGGVGKINMAVGVGRVPHNAEEFPHPICINTSARREMVVARFTSGLYLLRLVSSPDLIQFRRAVPRLDGYVAVREIAVVFNAVAAGCPAIQHKRQFAVGGNPFAVIFARDV